MNGLVLTILIAPGKGAPMQRRSKVRAEAATGLEGDRYHEGTGAYSKDDRVPRDVTLISRKAIDEANSLLDEPFEWEETRRNIVTTGIDLNALVGREFTVGDVRMRGIELADPCNRPSKLAGKPGFKTAFENRGGLRARILSDGEIREGDAVTVCEAAP